jgi:hypothetical protein
MQSSITWETIPFALATCVFSAALIAVADPPRAPPAQAFAACTLKQAGEKCSVQLGDRELAGTCASGPEQKLFCRPDHPPACGPPPEAIAACSSKSVGEACSTQFPDGSPRSGVCRAEPEKIACAPVGMWKRL